VGNTCATVGSFVAFGSDPQPKISATKAPQIILDDVIEG
jgi:hypothetical protein